MNRPSGEYSGPSLNPLSVRTAARSLSGRMLCSAVTSLTKALQRGGEKRSRGQGAMSSRPTIA